MTGRRQRFLAALALALASTGCRQMVLLDDIGASVAGQDGGGERRGDDAVPADDGGPDDGGLDDGGLDGSRPSCTAGQPRRVPIRARTPEVVLSLERSTTMMAPFGDGDRLTATQRAILDGVKRHQGAVLFGYQEFPVSSTTCTSALGCCAGEVYRPVLFAYKNIDFRTHACETKGTCSNQATAPIGDAMFRCRAFFNGTNGTVRERFVVLFTDGPPGCGLSCMETADVVSKLNDDGVETFVVGIGDEALQHGECLNDLALAGGTARQDPPFFYLARDRGALATQLSTIFKGIAARSCRIDVLATPTDADQVTLLYRDMQIPRDRTKQNGWDFDGDLTVGITLFGAACEMLQTGKAEDLELVSGCTTPSL